MRAYTKIAALPTLLPPLFLASSKVVNPSVYFLGIKSRMSFEHRLYGSCASPFFTKVPMAVILTMTTSERIHTDHCKQLTSLCADTQMQLNPGRKHKDPRIRTSSHDLIDAYRNVCAQYAHIPAPILILEDDARIMRADLCMYREVEDFVIAGLCDVYSLGSCGEYDARVGRHRRFRDVMGFSQAIIWTHAARKRMLEQYSYEWTHIDVNFLSTLPRKYTYYKPLVVQLFPTTENMNEWCFVCSGHAWERALVRVWTTFLQRCLHLDESTRGWNALYAMNASAAYLRRTCMVVACLLIAAVVRRCGSVRRVRRA